jgi:hypothetical protein
MSDVCAAQGPGDTPARPGARCRRCVSQVGKSPSGHLFEPLTCGSSQSSMDSPELNPHTVVFNPNGTPTLVQLASARRMPRQQMSALRTTSTGPSLLAELAEHRSRASTPTKRLASPLPDPSMTACCASATNPVALGPASVIPPSKTQVAVRDETLAHAMRARLLPAVERHVG